MAANPGRGVGLDGGIVDPVGIDSDRGEAGSTGRRNQIGRREIPAAVGGQRKLHSRTTLLRVEHRADHRLADEPTVLLGRPAAFEHQQFVDFGRVAGPQDISDLVGRCAGAQLASGV
jgi:hypothetical protein